MEQRDALFVTNQDLPITDLKQFINKKGIKSAVILTTHHVFPFEYEAINSIIKELKIISFSDLLSEDDMVYCDKIAEEILISERISKSDKYYSNFMIQSRIEKNRIVHNYISKQYQFNNIYYMVGLGISEDFWKEFAIPVFVPENCPETNNKLIKKIMKYLSPLLNVAVTAKNFIIKIKEVYVIREENETYVFFSHLNRLRFVSGTHIEVKKFRMGLRLAGSLSRIITKKNITVITTDDFYRQFGNNAIFCMTIHDYDRSIANNLKIGLIFIDGYHPSNFPRTYVDNYGNSTFVVRTMFDEHWFKLYGKSTLKPPRFLDREFFKHCDAVPRKKILIAINHAGDWTSLINRSDTDRLIEAVVNVSQCFPTLSFRIRLHPTMNRPEHEGIHSIERIEKFVKFVNYQNLEISKQNLLDDLAWCEICVSEYSQVLLDSWREGKIGIALNITKRRSFVQDYADLDFFHAQSLEELSEILGNVVNDPSGISARQNQAVDRYNILLDQWLGEVKFF